MKIGGVTVQPPKNETVIIKREEGDIVITCKAVLDYEKFEKLCPQPQPREILRPNNVKSYAVNDPKYKEALDSWAIKQSSWLILESLSATEGLEWDTVNMEDPETFANYEEDLAKTFSLGERVKIIQAVNSACGLSVEKMEEAREVFLPETAQVAPQ